MSPNNMSENYRLRKHFLKTQEIPTQSLIKKKMSEPLAALYFKTMNPKLKVMVGLEPQMKGGGSNWYAPPKDLLEGRTVLRPISKEHLSKLNYLGIDAICTKPLENRRQNKILEVNKSISENDEKWKLFFEEQSEQFYKEYSMKAANKNTDEIRKEFDAFKNLYTTSINSIESVLYNAASSEIIRIQNETYQKMNDKYKTLVKEQATALYETFTNKLELENLRLKGEFVEALATRRTEIEYKIHDLKLEKHVNVEKFRKFWECQRLACQVYVALKEQEQCKKDIELSHYMHEKRKKYLSAEIANKDYEVIGLERKEKLQLKFDKMWQKKICCVVKHLQMYVSYCISLLPAHAEFFINMEKLMLLQLDEVLENPSAQSIFKESQSYEGPRPDPHPFYLFCDKSQKPKELSLEKDLCPKRCTSSASHMPVIVINKRLMYAACDNFEQFTNKVEHYIQGERGDNTDFTDDHVYEQDVPVKYTTSQHLLELKLESSLLQILQQEIPSPREKSMTCSVCKVPYCFCTSQAAQDTRTKSAAYEETGPQRSVTLTTPADNAFNITNAICGDHKIQLPGQSYLKFIQPKCTCSKTSKKHLMEHLPVYMRPPPVLDASSNWPNYETCSLPALKRMVREVRGSGALLIKETKDQAKTRDVATQYIDEQYDSLCNCFSDEKFMNDLMQTESPEVSHFYYPNPLSTENILKFLNYFDSRTSN